LSKKCETKSTREVDMRKWIAVIAVAALALLFVADGMAQPQRRAMRPQRAMGRMHIGMLRVLKMHQEEWNVTDDQLKQIEELQNAFQEKMVRMRNENNLQRLELRKLMQDLENLDYAEIKAVLSKTSAARQEMFIERLKLRDEIQKVLTPEQRDALKAWNKQSLKRRSAFWKELRGRFQRPGSRFRNFPRTRSRIRR